ncbi:hypothetical protein DL93DRAFT_2081144 [Clavulina sp. PMI_390]|nr:hypothetical protein DL93DRAFT_2081144 [Clavulina sp. PMI_390]
MSYQNDAQWPSASSSSSSVNGARSPPSSYFPSHLDTNTLTPNQSSQYAPVSSPSASFHVVQGSELPRHARDTTPTSPASAYSRRKSMGASASMLIGPDGNGSGSGSPVPRTHSGTLPLTSKSTIVRSKPTAFVRPEEVWREILKTAYGRDKAFKIIQYLMRVFVLVHSRSPKLFRFKNSHELVRRLNVAIGHLGMTRKNLIMFNWLTPLIHIISPSESSVPFASSAATLSSPTLMHRFLHAPPPVLLDLLNAITDDVATFWRLGLLGERIGSRAARLADWFWFASTLAGLVEVGAERAMVKGMLRELEARLYDAEMDKTTDLEKIDEQEKELSRLKSQFGWLAVTRLKLLLDLTFVCAYDLFKFKRARDPVKTISGLGSALLSTYKMYNSQQDTILKNNQ